MNKQILENENEILERQYHLRKIALSYWTPFAFCSSYCIIYPFLQKYKYSIPFTMLTAYFMSNLLKKYYSRIFNSVEYNRYKTFCLKYKLYSDII